MRKNNNKVTSESNLNKVKALKRHNETTDQLQPVVSQIMSDTQELLLLIVLSDLLPVEIHVKK